MNTTVSILVTLLKSKEWKEKETYFKTRLSKLSHLYSFWQRFKNKRLAPTIWAHSVTPGLLFAAANFIHTQKEKKNKTIFYLSSSIKKKVKIQSQTEKSWWGLQCSKTIQVQK